VKSLAWMVLILTAGVASGQYVERIVVLPDSLSGLDAPTVARPSPGRDALYVSGPGERWLLAADPTTGRKLVRESVSGGVDDICFSPTRQRVFCASAGADVIYVVDDSTHRVVDTLSAGTGPRRLFYDGLHDRVYCGGSNSVARIDAATSSVTWVVGVPGLCEAIVCDPVRGKVYSAMSGPDTDYVAVLDGTGGAILASIRMRDLDPDEKRIDLACHPPSGRLYCPNDEDGSIAVVDTDGDSVVSWIEGAEGLTRLCLDSTGRKLFVVDWCEDCVLVVDCAGDSVLGRVWTHEQPEVVVYDEDDDLVYVGEWGRVDVIDATADSIVASLVGVSAVSDLRYDARIGKVCALDVDSVVVVDAHSSAPVLSIRYRYRPGSAAYCGPEDKIYCLHGRSSVLPVRCSTGEVLGPVSGTEGGCDGAVCAQEVNKLYIWLTNRPRRALLVVDCASDSVVGAIEPYESGMPLYYPAGRRLYTPVADSGGFVVIDCLGDSLLPCVSAPEPTGTFALYAARDKLYYGVGSDVCVFDLAADTVAAILSTVVTPDHWCSVERGDAMCGVTYTGQLLVLDGEGDSLVATASLGLPHTSALAFSPLSSKLYCSDIDLSAVAVLDWPTLTRLGTIPVDFHPSALEIDTVADILYCLSWYDGPLTAIDCHTDSVVAVFDVFEAPRWPVFDGEHRRLFVPDQRGSSVIFIRDTTEAAVAEVRAGRRVSDRASIVRGCLRLPDADIRHSTFALLNSVGRRVMELAPGDNDVRGLAPGVYFVREEGPRVRGAEGSRVRKVVILE